MYSTIPTAALTVGMYVAKEVKPPPAEGKVYCVEGLITYQEEVATIVAQGYEWVVVDSTKGVAPQADASVTGGSADRIGALLSVEIVRPKNVLPLNGELKAARSIQREAQNHVKDLLRRVRQNMTPNIDATEGVVIRMMDSLQRNSDAMNGLNYLKPPEDRYAARCMTVTTLSLSFGHYMGLGKKPLAALGLAGMFNNVNRNSMSEQLPCELEAEDLVPVDGLAGGKSGGGLGDSGKVLARLHRLHTRHNLPQIFDQFSGQELEWVSQVVALSDVFEHLTNRTGGRCRMLQPQAVGKLYSMGDSMVSRPVLEHFIRCIGVYPFGSMVKLSDGRHGFVCSSPGDSAMTPKVRVVLDEKLRPIPPKEIDLAASPELSIVTCLDPAKHGLDPSRFLLG